MAAHNNSKTGYMAIYDADDTTVIVDGMEMYGFATSGEMVQVAYDNDNVQIASDPQGTTVLSRLHKGTGTITLNLSQSSPCNAKLTELANNLTEFAIDIQDSTDHSWDPHVVIAKIPDRSDGEQAGTRAWQLKALNLNTESKLSM